MDLAAAGIPAFLTAVAAALPGFAVKSTLVLGGAWCIDRCWRRAPAARRHRLWAVSLAGLPWLLAAESLLPAWTLPLLPPAAALPPSGEAGGFPVGEALAAVWLLGAAWLLLRAGAGAIGVARLRSRAVVFGDPRLLAEAGEVAGRLGLEDRKILYARVAGLSGPCVAGLWRPLVILPEDAPGWDGERRRQVLGHELAHLARRDLLCQAIARLAVAAAFFHPLVWLAQRRLREESEKACDDQVLRLGARASSYAGMLLAASAGHRETPFFAAAFGSKGEIESRLLAILDPGVRREVHPRRERAVAALFLVALLPLAALEADRAPSAGLEISPPDPLAAPAPVDPVAAPDEPSPPD